MITRSEKIKAGILFVTGVGILVGFLVFLGYMETQEKGEVFHSYFVDITSLHSGAPVKYNGVKVGEVTNITIPTPGKPRVRVDYRIERPELVTPNTYAQLTYVTYLSGQQGISLTPRDTKCEGAETAGVQGYRIPSCRSDVTLAFDTILTSVQSLNDLLEKNGAQFTRLIHNTDKVFEDLRTLISGQPKMEEVPDGSLLAVSQRLDKLMVQLNGVSEKLDRTLDQAHGTFAKTQGMVDNVSELSGSLRSVVDENKTDIKTAVRNFSDACQSLQKTIDENEERIATITTNVDRMTKDLRGLSSDARKAWPMARISQDAENWSETLSQLNDLTRQTRQLAHSLQEASNSLDNVLQENRGTLNTALRNIVNATENVRNFARKLQAQPSLLITSPTRKKRRLDK